MGVFDKGNNRVVRGGSWNNDNPTNFRSANRQQRFSPCQHEPLARAAAPKGTTGAPGPSTECPVRKAEYQTGRARLAALVKAGARYPCIVMHPQKPGESLVLTIKASHEEQTRLGMEIFEVAHRESLATGGGGFDLVFDASGAARYSQREDMDDATHRSMGSATFVHADPPAKKGDPRFLATFAIDAQKRLCVTVKDSSAGKTLMRDFPMVKLT